MKISVPWNFIFILWLAVVSFGETGARAQDSSAQVLAGSSSTDGKHNAPTTPRTDADVVPPRLIRRVEPVYPDIFSATPIDAEIVVAFTIATDGTVKNIKVTKGPPPLIQSAVHAVSQWRYEPARKNGVAVAVTTIAVFNYKLALDRSSSGGPPPANVSPLQRSALTPPPDGVMRVSGPVMAAMQAHRVEPVYPLDAISLDARGDVVLLAIIDTDGGVDDVEVMSGPTRFRDAAIAAVKQWRYKPYLIDEKPVPVQTAITLSFAPPPPAGTPKP